MSMDRSSRQKINKEIYALNIILDQTDLIDLYETLHPNSTVYTFFSSCTRNILQDKTHTRL